MKAGLVRGDGPSGTTRLNPRTDYFCLFSFWLPTGRCPFILTPVRPLRIVPRSQVLCPPLEPAGFWHDTAPGTCPGLTLHLFPLPFFPPIFLLTPPPPFPFLECYRRNLALAPRLALYRPFFFGAP